MIKFLLSKVIGAKEMTANLKVEFEKINREFKDKNPLEIIQWAVSLEGVKPLVTTHFGPFEAAILYTAIKARSDIPVLWCDSGYNTESTYRFAHRMKSELNLNLHIYTPKISAAYRNINLGGIPLLEDKKAHEEFTQEVKLEPFSRALDALKPNLWLTSLRKEQTAHRATLDIAVPERDNMVKINPFFYFSERDMESYLHDHQLPNEKDYFDPTKVLEKRECGLHVKPSPQTTSE